MNHLCISGYKFVDIPNTELPTLRDHLYQVAQQRQLKGTILLSEEGVNIFLAGESSQISDYQQFLNTFSYFTDLTYRKNRCETPPFNRLQVRIKPEIITMGQTHIKPAKKTAPYLTPKKLKQWYDEKKDMIILDTRNQYEYAFGSFDQAIHLNIKHFKHFGEALKQLPQEMKQKTIVTFCTGGIRCEKAAAYMQEQGFSDVYQLQGGILNYFAECQGKHFHGECFVFDNRVTVDSNLAVTDTTHCHVCQAPITDPNRVECSQCLGPVRKKSVKQQ